jgi:isoquinoline 1-oxidoreductase beta subunit
MSEPFVSKAAINDATAKAPAVLSRASRRNFLKSAAATAAGLTIGFHWSGPLSRALAETPKDFVPNAFLRIAPDNSVTVIAKHLEMGQGSYTGLATIIAEELDADWGQIRVESAPADASKYANLRFGTIQGTGGSSAMNNSWMQLRKAGATARAMLVAAAAAEWNVAPASLVVEHGVVSHAPSHRTATFGELAAKASGQPVPADVPLKEPKDFKLIGQKLPRVDLPGKTNGTAQFTIDVTFPGMLVALLQRPPWFGGTVKSCEPTRRTHCDRISLPLADLPDGAGLAASAETNTCHPRSGTSGTIATFESEPQCPGS